MYRVYPHVVQCLRGILPCTTEYLANHGTTLMSVNLNIMFLHVHVHTYNVHVHVHVCVCGGGGMMDDLTNLTPPVPFSL